jgi:hypothetical protein
MKDDGKEMYVYGDLIGQKRPPHFSWEIFMIFEKWLVDSLIR